MKRMGNNGILILVAIIVVVCILDKSIVPVSLYTGGVKSTASDIGIFILISLTYAIGQWIILQYVELKFKTSKRWISLLYTIVIIVQYILISILVTIILEMIFASTYNSFLMKLCIWINYIMMVVILGILANRFFSWYRSHRSSIPYNRNDLTEAAYHRALACDTQHSEGS